MSRSDLADDPHEGRHVVAEADGAVVVLLALTAVLLGAIRAAVAVLAARTFGAARCGAAARRVAGLASRSVFSDLIACLRSRRASITAAGTSDGCSAISAAAASTLRLGLRVRRAPRSSPPSRLAAASLPPARRGRGGALRPRLRWRRPSTGRRHAIRSSGRSAARWRRCIWCRDLVAMVKALPERPARPVRPMRWT